MAPRHHETERHEVTAMTTKKEYTKPRLKRLGRLRDRTRWSLPPE